MTEQAAELLGSNIPDETPIKAVGLPGYKRIILEENDEIPPTGLFIGLNGKGYVLRPGEPCNVPDGVIGILKDAITAQPVTDPQTRRVGGYRNKMRFPFRYVSDEE